MDFELKQVVCVFSYEKNNKLDYNNGYRPIFELFGPKRGPRVNLTEKFFSSKDAPGTKLSFDGKKSRVPGEKSRVPGQKPHFLTFLVRNGVQGSI